MILIKKLPFAQSGLPTTDETEHWQFFVICQPDGSSQVMEFLNEVRASKELRTRADDFFATLEDMQREPSGPQALVGTSRCHESVAGERIFEFRHGALRVHWFYAEKRCVVILARAAKTTTNQTPKPLADQLKKLKRAYEVAAKSSSIQEL